MACQLYFLNGLGQVDRNHFHFHVFKINASELYAFVPNSSSVWVLHWPGNEQHKSTCVSCNGSDSSMYVVTLFLWNIETTNSWPFTFLGCYNFMCPNFPIDVANFSGFPIRFLYPYTWNDTILQVVSTCEYIVLDNL